MLNIYSVAYTYRSYNLNNTIFNVVDTVIAPTAQVAEATAVKFIPKRKWSNLHVLECVASNVNPADYNGNAERCYEVFILHHSPVAIAA